jgi:hypothetical protein
MAKWFVCLKHGNKYSAEYVNVLHSMFKRNTTLDVRFACYTENRQGLNKDIEVFPLPYNLGVSGWWYKPMFFDPNLPTQGTVLFSDLDVVIFRNIDKFYNVYPNKFCILRDFTRAMRPNWPKFNSSIFRLETGTHSYVYDNFVKNPYEYIKRYHGDQDYIYDQVIQNTQPYQFYPDDWAQSYKWEMRKIKNMARRNGIRTFPEKGVPYVKEETAIAVFHGEPNPSQCDDDWVIKHWK